MTGCLNADLCVCKQRPFMAAELATTDMVTAGASVGRWTRLRAEGRSSGGYMHASGGGGVEPMGGFGKT